MKKNNIILIIVIIISFIVAGILSYNEEKRHLKQLSRYEIINTIDSFEITVNSACFYQRDFIINDTFVCFAQQQRDSGYRYLYQYMMIGDLMVKRKNNDTLYILRDYNIEKFNIVRDDGSEPILSPREMIKLWF